MIGTYESRKNRGWAKYEMWNSAEPDPAQDGRGTEQTREN
jgi:hypothetical protein